MGVYKTGGHTFCLEGRPMRKDKPSRTARKVALNIVTLGAKPGMGKVLPPGIVDATAELLVASGATGARCGFLGLAMR